MPSRRARRLLGPTFARRASVRKLGLEALRLGVAATPARKSVASLTVAEVTD